MSVDKKINNTTILTSNQTTTTKTHTEKNNRKEKQRKLSTKHCVGARKKEGTDSSFNCENKKFLEGLSASTDAKCTETVQNATLLGIQTDPLPLPLTHRRHCDKTRVLWILYKINLSAPHIMVCSCWRSGLHSWDCRKSCKTKVEK